MGFTKVLTGALAAATATATAVRFEGDRVLRLLASEQEQFKSALDYLTDMDGPGGEYDVWRIGKSDIDVHVTEGQLEDFSQAMKERGLTATTWIEDLQKLVDESSEPAPRIASVDPFFDDYRSTEEIRRFTQSIAQNATGRAVFVPSIGTSSEGRDIFGIRLGGNGRPGRPSVYLQGGLHAREWASPSTVMYIMHELAYSEDPEIRALLEEVEVIIFPQVNPDGYEFSRNSNRFWRKSRNVNPGSGCIGTDLNRNWDDHWGGGGSSGNACSDTYRGSAPFSAPETKAIEEYLMGPVRTETTLLGAIDFHSYGQLILRPFGWQLPFQGRPDNEVELRGLGADMRDAILNAGYNTRYTSEHSAELYIASGGSDDWFHSVATDYNDSPRGQDGIGYCYELRDTGRFGFAVPPVQIVPQGVEVTAAMKVFLKHIADKF